MQQRTAGECVVMFSRSFARKGHREVGQLLEKIVVSRDPFLFQMREVTAVYADHDDPVGSGNVGAGKPEQCP